MNYFKEKSKTFNYIWLIYSYRYIPSVFMEELNEFEYDVFIEDKVLKTNDLYVKINGVLNTKTVKYLDNSPYFKFKYIVKDKEVGINEVSQVLVFKFEPNKKLSEYLNGRLSKIYTAKEFDVRLLKYYNDPTAFKILRRDADYWTTRIVPLFRDKTYAELMERQAGEWDKIDWERETF